MATPTADAPAEVPGPPLWWALMVRGVPALLFGLLTVFWPDVPAPIRGTATGAYFVLAGLGTLMLIRPLAPLPVKRGLLYLQGALWLVGGVLVLAIATSPWAYILIAGGCALCAGAAEVLFSLRYRRMLDVGRDLLITGGLTVVTGISLLVIGSVATRAPAGVMGAGAVATGVVLAIAAASNRSNRYETYPWFKRAQEG